MIIIIIRLIIILIFINKGRALSLVTQYDVELVHSIEEFIGIKLEESKEITHDDVVPLLNPVAKAMRVAKLKLMESGFEEKVEIFTERKNNEKRKRKKAESLI